ncbi:MAG: right-handed parallel beta-helix repeat-containing protein [Candidatus Moranbacteria bacterium]|nr:right-handed parallel beta-helix repeat-containing protein [Candidatus Moranbacteria bacterium]
MLNTSKIDLKRVFIAFLVLAVVVPFLTFADHNKKIFVDDNTGKTQDGSSKHPYKTISQALKKANKNTEILVSSGLYKENLVVPKGVEIYGHDRDETIIEAKSDDDSAVYLNGGSKLDKLTIKGGKNGVKVADGGRVKILNCIIKNNNRDGVIIYDGKLDDNNKVTISGTKIKDNGRNGIYAQKRNLVIVENDINNNGSDGVSFESGAKAWIGGTNFRDNSGSGLKVRLDGAQIFTKNNTFINNSREGVEVDAYGAAGRVDINWAKFENNGNYGIARIQRAAFSGNIWKGLTEEGTTFFKTEKGNVSAILNLFN